MMNDKLQCEVGEFFILDESKDAPSLLDIVKKTDKKQTVFDRISASPEVLAPKLVYSTYTKIKKPLYDWRRMQIANRLVLRVIWGSSVTDETYFTKAEAIAATLEKLKEVAE